MVRVPKTDRRLAVSVTGDPDGAPVFLLHGTPGSRIGPKPREMVLHELGVRLFSFDRPGYGLSDRDRGRRVAGAADDVATIAKFFDLREFAVVGRSGGGPHALAVAALLPKLVTRVAVLVSLAPADAEHLDWYAGMGEGNVREYSTADADEQRMIAAITKRAKLLHHDSDGFLNDLEKQSHTDADRRVLRDVALRRQLRETYAEAVRYGPGGWIDDVLAFRRGWKFELSEVTAPTRLWHGQEDTFSPYRHTQWLSSRIHDVEFEVEPGLGHFGAVEVLPRILSWLLHGSNEPSRSFAVRSSLTTVTPVGLGPR